MYTLYFIVHVDGRPNQIKSNQNNRLNGIIYLAIQATVILSNSIEVIELNCTTQVDYTIA